MPFQYFHRAYAARDCMRYELAWPCMDVGHADGGYCLDAVTAPTGGHVADDFVYHGTI